MRLLQFRPRIRTLLLLLLAVLVSLGLVGQRIYHEGPETHWLLLRLRFGNVEARRSAALQARESERKVMFNLINPLAGPANPRTIAAWQRYGRRRAELLLPALVVASKDSDAECRANSLRALSTVAALHSSGPEKSLALRQILAATRDRNDSVRTTAIGSIVSVADRDLGAVSEAIRLALADPSLEVRQSAARGLGMLGREFPQTQPEAASTLIPMLASREDSRVRVAAAWGLFLFGIDSQRHPPGTGPDVVPALIAALQDSHVEVRRTAADILGPTTIDARGRPISSWEERKDSIIPALVAATSDADKAVREGSALALFALGQRDQAVIELIEQAARDPARSQRSGFESALKEWQGEREERESVGLDPPEPE